MDHEAISDLFAGLGPVSIRRMFGGKGIYFEGVIIAVELRGELMLKGDAVVAPDYEAAGWQAMDLRPLAPRQGGRDAILVAARRGGRQRRRDDALGEEGLRGGQAVEQIEVYSAFAILAASRALFSTSAMLVLRLAPSVSSSSLASRNGVTALPTTFCSCAALCAAAM